MLLKIQPKPGDGSATGAYGGTGEGDLAIVSADDPIPPWMTARTVVEVDDSERENEVRRLSL